MLSIRVCALVVWFAALAFAAEARGSLHAQGCNYFTGYRLRFEKLDGKKLATPIAFNFPQSYFWENIQKEKESWKVSAPECSAASPCEPGAHGTVRILDIRRHFSLRYRHRIISGIAGEFSIELGDGRKIEGSFQARVRSSGPRIICE